LRPKPAYAQKQFTPVAFGFAAATEGVRDPAAAFIPVPCVEMTRICGLWGLGLLGGLGFPGSDGLPAGRPAKRTQPRRVRGCERERAGGRERESKPESESGSEKGVEENQVHQFGLHVYWVLTAFWSIDQLVVGIFPRLQGW